MRGYDYTRASKPMRKGLEDIEDILVDLSNALACCLFFLVISRLLYNCFGCKTVISIINSQLFLALEFGFLKWTLSPLAAQS
jgi:hypothetical protein